MDITEFEHSRLKFIKIDIAVVLNVDVVIGFEKYFLNEMRVRLCHVKGHETYLLGNTVLILHRCIYLSLHKFMHEFHFILLYRK